MVLQLFVMSILFFLNIAATTEDDLVNKERQDVAYAIQTLLEYEKTAKEMMIKKLSKLPKNQVMQFIKNYEEQQQQLEGHGGMGLDTIVFDNWYPTSDKTVFSSEAERKKFEKAMKEGVLVGIHNEKAFAVLTVDDYIYFIPSGMEQAMGLAQSFQADLEAASEKFFIAPQENETREKPETQKNIEAKIASAESMIQESKKIKDKKKAQELVELAQKVFMEAQEELALHMETALKTVCDQYIANFGEGFLYDILFLRVFGNVSNKWMPDVIASVKTKFKK